MPLKSGEGRYVASEAVLDELEGEGRVVFRYATAEGAITRPDLERILENGPALSSPARAAGQSFEDPFRAESFEDFKERSEALFFRLKLAENEGNVKRTAERLHMQRSHLYKKLERFGLK